MKHRVLVVDDETKFVKVLSVALAGFGYEVVTANDGVEALRQFDTRAVDVVLTDLRMHGMSGAELLNELNRRAPNVPVIIMTAYSSIKDAVSLAKAGAFDYLAKPLDIDALEGALRNATRLLDTIRDNERLRSELSGQYKSENLIGSSAPFRQVIAAISELRDSKANVLITGESGTGKELVARAVHFNSPFKKGAFVAVNCAAIPEGLLESELFGHVKGAFTGAVTSRVGRFVQAEGGTLFLDEIGDMSLALQAKILRAIQERTFQPVGSVESRTVELRIIAATNQSLQDAVLDGKFRNDLFYRLNVFPIALPSLRTRSSDIPELATHFLGAMTRATGKRILAFSDAALVAMRAYPWPGNVRELQNCIERAVIVTKGETIELSDLPGYLLEVPVTRSWQLQFPANLDARLADYERKMIVDALDQCGGVQVAAAVLLGISERSLWHRVKKYSIRFSTKSI